MMVDVGWQWLVAEPLGGLVFFWGVELSFGSYVLGGSEDSCFVEMGRLCVGWKWSWRGLKMPRLVG